MRCPSQHGLHVIPAVLDRIQIGAISRPVDHLEALLGQERLYSLGGVAGRVILQKVHAAVDVHELQQVVFQHSLITLAIHGSIFGQKVKSAMPNGAGKTSPNHDTVRVLEGLHSVLAFVPDGALRPPHLGPDALERRLVRIRDLAVFSREMLIRHGELESFRLHFLCKKRLHGDNKARHLQVDLQCMLDGPL
jgi:hypothetical protein